MKAATPKCCVRSDDGLSLHACVILCDGTFHCCVGVASCVVEKPNEEAATPFAELAHIGVSLRLFNACDGAFHSGSNLGGGSFSLDDCVCCELVKVVRYGCLPLNKSKKKA